jgi:hypothetical protein
MFWKLSAALLGCAVAVAAFDGLPPYTGPYPLQDRDHAAPMSSSRLELKPKPVVDILFVGNSFTFTGDMPAQLVNIAASDPSARVGLRVSAATIPGAPLSQDWDQGDALKLLKSRHFDYVVLQEESAWPYRQDPKPTYDAIGQWIDAARAAGAKPVLFETWADKDGGPSYQPGWICDGMTPASAQAAVAEATDKLAATYGLDVVRVGDRFTTIAQTPGAPELFKADRHHPSQAGAFVSALMFYKALAGGDATRVRYRPPDLTAAQAARIEALVAPA